MGDQKYDEIFRDPKVRGTRGQGQGWGRGRSWGIRADRAATRRAPSNLLFADPDILDKIHFT